ncbi:MAG: hypothetical protein ACYDA9_14105 [Terriglobia bacterium]
MKTFSTKQAAQMARIHGVTLRRWLAAKKVRPSIAFPVNGRTLWRWTANDVSKLKKYREKHYGKGKGPSKAL